MVSTPAFVPDVVLCGEALIDIVELEDRSTIDVPGGSPLNIAVALSRQGIKTSLVSRLSNDHFGALLRAALGESRVDLSRAISCYQPTTLALATPNGKGGMNFSFEIDGRSDGEWKTTDTNNISQGAKFLIFSGALAMAIPSMALAMDNAVSQASDDCVIFFDPNVRPAMIKNFDVVATKMDEWCSQATIIRASKKDIKWRWPELDPLKVAKSWVDAGAAFVVVTDGPNSIFACHKNGEISRDVRNVEVVDTIGAGDAMVAGLIEWFLLNNKSTKNDIYQLNKEEIIAAVEAGLDLSADTCIRNGADPPWKSERTNFSIPETIEVSTSDTKLENV